jgi:hypothetical protein
VECWHVLQDIGSRLGTRIGSCVTAAYIFLAAEVERVLVAFGFDPAVAIAAVIFFVGVEPDYERIYVGAVWGRAGA